MDKTFTGILLKDGKYYMHTVFSNGDTLNMPINEDMAIRLVHKHNLELITKL